MTETGIGIYPGGTNPVFIHLTGTIVSWWARTEGIMITDIMALRTQPLSAQIVQKAAFPQRTRDTVRHWATLLLNAYENDGEQRGKIEKVVTKALELLEHRDRLVHSFWPYGQADSDKLELRWIRPDKTQQYGVRRGVYSMSVSELDAVNQSFAHLYNAVMAISFNSHRLYHGKAKQPPTTSPPKPC